MQTPFLAYYNALKLNCLQDEDKLLPVFSSSAISVYPYQVAAALFAMRNPYQKGVILCDEAGMGKSHEAMLIISQSLYEGKNKILVAIPNSDLMMQWDEMIEGKYSIPCCVLSDGDMFDFDGIVLATYDTIVNKIDKAEKINWDIIVFEEANALTSVYLEEGGKQAKVLKKLSENAFKILLTGTPIEKNIMDLYGLIYFIDENLLPDSDSYMKRYLRKPENYSELAGKVSKYCFRTLKMQAKQYAKIPNRLHITLEYEPTDEEKELYNLLFNYIEKPNKIAFPQMEKYDLALMLLGLLSSSTSAVKASFAKVVSRLLQLGIRSEELGIEIAEFEKMLEVAENIKDDTKANELLSSLDKIFPLLKKTGAKQKAVIFTESVETQKYLYSKLSAKYKTALYNGQTDYREIKNFLDDGEILISTDNGAKGFNLEQCSFVVNYDLLYNTLKMEQRIDRIHRLNQQNDCIVLSFINKENFADVRKLELVSKRHILSDGVFGVSDSVIGGFCDDLSKALKSLEIRSKTEVEKDYQHTLLTNETQNRELVKSSEDMLFTTFTKEVYEKIKITPQYVEEKSKELNHELWEIVKFYFENYNKNNEDCYFNIDDEKQTVTATDYEKLPKLFYYPTNNGNKAYNSLKEFKNITLMSPLAKGILFNLECSDEGQIINDNAECKIALYLVELYAGKRNIKRLPVLVGVDKDGQIINHTQCENILNLPAKSFREAGRKQPSWLKSPSRNELDNILNLDELIENEQEKLTPYQKEEVDRLKLFAKIKKNELNHALDDFNVQMKELLREREGVKSDRMKILMLDRKISLLNNEISKKKEGLFFDEMQIDVDLENKINEFLGREKITAKYIRQFVVDFRKEVLI